MIKMKFKGLRVLLLDGFCRQNCILLKELHDLQCVVTTLCDSKLDVSYASKYPKKRIIDKKFKSDIAYYEKLIFDLAKTGAYDVIFPVVEESTEIISKNFDELRKYCRLICPPFDAFMKARDKQLTMKLCMENGIFCPKTKMDNESIEEYLATVNFPLALKPREGRGSVGFKKVNNKDELYKLINEKIISVEEYVIQEFIDEAEVHRVSYTFIDNDGIVKSSLISKSTRPYPLGVGTNSLFESVDMPEIAKQSENLLKIMGWRGYASVCFIENKDDGIPKVMEINGRISASFKISVIAGLHIVEQLLERALDMPVTPAPDKLKYGARVKHSQSSVLWFLKSTDRFRKEPTSTGKKHLKKDIVFSWKDPWPYVTYSIQCLKKYKKEMKKRER